MDSLHAPCTPLKKAYDSCFNHWFEEYLSVAAPKPGSRPQSTLPLSSAAPQASTSNSNGSSSKSSIAIAAEGLSNENSSPSEAEARQAKIRAKAEEYEQKCGDTWRAYRTCLEVCNGTSRVTTPLTALCVHHTPGWTTRQGSQAINTRST